MRIPYAFAAMLSVITLSATDLHIVVRTTDAVVVQVSVVCPGDTGLMVLNQFEERQPGSASWRGVGGVPPYRLVDEEVSDVGVVCFTVVDAMGQQARGCGVINELRTTRIDGCNGARSYGLSSGTEGAVQPPLAGTGAKSAAASEPPPPQGGPRVVKRSSIRDEQSGGRPPVERRDQIREVRPAPPAPRPQQQEQRGGSPTTPQPMPRRPQGY